MDLFCVFVVAYLVPCVYNFLFCFFKQKTAYEMRISDWSSDVCSSDLEGRAAEILDEIDLRAVQQFQRGLVDHRGDAVAHEGAVVGIHGVVEGEAVLEAGAAAAGDRDAQHQAGVAVLLDQPGDPLGRPRREGNFQRSEEHTSELQSLMRISY